MAASLSDRARLEQPAEAWWACWLEFQRLLGVDKAGCAAAERLVEVVRTNLGRAPLGDLSVDGLRRLIDGTIAIEALPAPIAAILSTSGDAVFFERWLAVGRVAGVGLEVRDRPAPAR